jgi:putative transposase
MPNYRRAKNGEAFFFTVVTHRRQPILCHEASRTILREVIREIKVSHPFDIEAWVLLPDHMHCIWRLPGGDRDYSMRWGWIKKEFTKRIRGFEGFRFEVDDEGMVGGAHPTRIGGAENDADMRNLTGMVGTAHPTGMGGKLGGRDVGIVVGTAHPTAKSGARNHAQGSDVSGTADPTSSRMRHREGMIWQRRFWEHMVRDDDDFRAHCDYIHLNPVKHGLVESVVEWPFSTFHRFVRKGIYHESWGGGGVEFPEGLGNE